jgi:hypothetical protein
MMGANMGKHKKSKIDKKIKKMKKELKKEKKAMKKEKGSKVDRSDVPPVTPTST